MQEQNWEYLHIVCEQGRPRYVNGHEIPNWQQGPVLFQAVNYLYQKGWKPVDNPLGQNTVSYVFRPQIRYHFRRRKG